MVVLIWVLKSVATFYFINVVFKFVYLFVFWDVVVNGHIVINVNNPIQLNCIVKVYGIDIVNCTYIQG